MRVTEKTNTIHYLPQEIRETRLTEVTYLPITREMLEQLFSNSAQKDKHKLVKKRRMLNSCRRFPRVRPTMRCSPTKS